MEKIIESRQCKQCGINFDITDRDMEFYDKISLVIVGKKYLIPPSDICSECNQQHLLLTRNERSLYKRKCDLSGKDMLSVYSPDAPYKVYYRSERWSDKRDPMDYGRDVNLDKDIIQQFRKLSVAVPRYNLYNFDTENCEYVQYVPHSKNCYLCFGCTKIEDSCYGSLFIGGKDAFDGLQYRDCDACFQCINIEKCYQLFYGYNCISCSQSSFLFDCVNCDNCIGCWNLRNKSYHILNQSVSKETFDKKKQEIFATYTSVKNFLSDFRDIVKTKTIHKYYIGEHNDHVSGNYISNSKHCKNVYFGNECENVSHSYRVFTQKDTQFINGCMEGSLIYKAISCDNGYKVVCSKDSEHCSNCYYVDVCDHCSDLFACVGLRNKQYCILNKQYTKKEYEQLVPKIIEKMRVPSSAGKSDGQWGVFFDDAYCSYGYNETVALDYFPLSKEEAERKGFKRSDYEQSLPQVEKILKATELPENIDEVSDDILQQAIECKVSGKLFRVVKQELEFYRKHHLPLPREHPDIRHIERMNMRNPRTLWDRECGKCGTDIQTTYSTDRSEIVYCESCCSKEIYG